MAALESACCSAHLPPPHTSHLSLRPSHQPRAEQAAVVCRDSANRWTDNVFTLQTWMRKKFPGQEAALAGFFKEQGVGEDFDYVA